MTSKEIRQKYLDFFKSKGHREIPAAPLVLEDDPTTLFTSSGMQPLVPHLLGEKHPMGVRLVNSQPSFRSGDIEEVGDSRHTTFFEMLGNWSLGDYFKKQQLEWIWEFLTKEIGLDKERLYVSIFKGNEIVLKDDESKKIWKELGISEDHIFEYGVEKNWWSKSGIPENMPVGEIGGPDSEIFYEFIDILHDPKFGEKCHPNCDCGRFLEIGNSVFIEYKKVGDSDFEKLPQQNVDFGGGLERITAASENSSDVFKTDLYVQIIHTVEENIDGSYKDEQLKPTLRIIADHLKAATFLIISGVIPSNKLAGYILRRLIRRVAIKIHPIRKKEVPTDGLISVVCEAVLETYDGILGVKKDIQREKVVRIVVEEIERFGKSLEKGLKEIEKLENIDGKIAFNLYQTFGFPLEVTEELVRQKGQKLDREQFREEFKKHQEVSRAGSAGKFSGGLAGNSEIEIKYHTTTHLLQQALRDVLGSEVFQKGSNITQERLRFDFSYDKKMTEEEIKKTEEIINERISQNLKVDRKFMSVEEAKKLNAIGLFNEKYDKEVSVYAIGPDFETDKDAKDKRERGGYYSMEFCGGPHVEHTGVIGKVKLVKEEAVSSGVRRIRVELL